MSEGGAAYPAASLNQRLAEALEGGRAAVEAFYRGLLSARIIVPRRYQAMPLSDSPTYPHELFDLLGVKDKERVVIPIFADAEMVREWSGTEFVVREMSFAEFAGLVPEQWWVILNPGCEFEKEFSPWEIQQLKDGESALPLLVDEALAHEREDGFSFCDPGAEFAALKEQLTQFARTRPVIEALYLVRREAKIEDSALPALVIGVRTELAAATEQEQLRQEVVAVAEGAVIGAASVQVMLGGAVGGSMLDQVFSGFPPFFLCQPPAKGFFAKVFEWFSRSPS